MVVHWQTHLSGRTVDAATALVPHELPRNISGSPPLPPTAVPPTALEPALPVFTVSGQDRPSSVDEGPRRVDRLFEEEFIGQAAAEFTRGDGLFAAGDVNGAILAYMSAEEHHGRNSAALQNMVGRVYQAYGNHRSAEYHFKRSINISDNPVTRWNRALSLLRLRQCVPAVEDAEWLLEAENVALPELIAWNFPGRGSNTHLGAHFVIVGCHEPDLARAGWDRVNGKPVLEFGSDDEDTVEVSPCHSSFYHWSDVEWPFVIRGFSTKERKRRGDAGVGSASPCANGWRNPDRKAKFSEHARAGLKLVDEAGLPDDDGLGEYFREAVAAGLLLKGIPQEVEETEGCSFVSSVPVPDIADARGTSPEDLAEAYQLLRVQLNGGRIDQRSYELRTLRMLIAAACRDRLDPRHIEDLNRRLEALSGS